MRRQRRIQWIRYYVSIGHHGKAFDVGWDGRSFKEGKTSKNEEDNMRDDEDDGDGGDDD